MYDLDYEGYIISMSPHKQNLLTQPFPFELMVYLNVVPQSIQNPIETVLLLELGGRRAIKLAEAALVRCGHKTLRLFSFFIVGVPISS